MRSYRIKGSEGVEMPTARPPYDGDIIWKHREYDEAQWRELNIQVQKSLRPLYPDQTAIADPPFEHPADTWATELLNVAHGEITRAQWLGRRRTNEELRAEQKDILKILEKPKKRLGSLSHDLAMMLDQDVDVLGCRDEIIKLIGSIEGTASKIGKLPRAKKRQVVEHQAAIRMAHYVLPILSAEGIPSSATANTDLDNFSNAIEILKIIGDALGLILAKATWKGILIKAKPSSKSKHPKKGVLRTPRSGRQ
jgi:hypothetical protein